MFLEYHTSILPLNYPDLCKELKNKKPETCDSGFWFVKTFQFYLLSRKPSPVSIPLFLPVKSEQNIEIPLRLEVDVIMADMFLYVFIIFKYYKFVFY